MKIFRVFNCFMYTEECQPLLEDAVCSVKSLSMTKGSNIQWNCQLIAAKATNFSLMLNKMIVIPPSKPEEGKCRDEPQVIAFVKETPQNVCFSKFSVVVLICSASESVVGEFNLMTSSGTIVKGSTVVVQLMQEYVNSPGIRVTNTLLYSYIPPENYLSLGLQLISYITF